MLKNTSCFCCPQLLIPICIFVIYTAWLQKCNSRGQAIVQKARTFGRVLPPNSDPLRRQSHRIIIRSWFWGFPSVDCNSWKEFIFSCIRKQLWFSFGGIFKYLSINGGLALKRHDFVLLLTEATWILLQNKVTAETVWCINFLFSCFFTSANFICLTV